ncbi:hypothetical protein BGZ65_005318 [Modicella reniformis]|uniref:Uncharacterized protein n=1 Tax=Modicella reniformis TaxID=1440133 RepID=A0A9P6M8M2_9FUNG|nr:hypothetical protein BGZ65_005318 [Modicella reniformis]
MLSVHKEYFNTTRQISIVSFMRAFPDIKDKDRLVGYWTGQVVPFLRAHPSREKFGLGAYFAKMSAYEVSSVIEEELRARLHMESLAPNVSRQERAISGQQTRRVEDICSSIGVTSSASASSTVPSLHMEEYCSQGSPSGSPPSGTPPSGPPPSGVSPSPPSASACTPTASSSTSVSYSSAPVGVSTQPVAKALKKLPKNRKGKEKAGVDEDATEGCRYDVEEFERMVEQLDRRQFWRLECSGRYVEDVLIKAARETCTVQHHIHSLVIHTADKHTRDLFTADEWLEVCNTNWKALPQPSSDIMQYLETFNKDNIEELHQAANVPLPITGPYDHENHWMYRWIRITIENWLGIYCQQPAPLKTSQQESFWHNDVLNMINSLFRDVQDLVVGYVRRVHCVDTAEGRNENQLGNVFAQNSFGYCYEDGVGIEQNLELAAIWYTKSAQQGYPWAECNLGYCNQNGIGVPKDDAKGAYWYRKAALQGHARAQHNLGFCYQNGIGVTKDPVEAVR